MRLLATWILLLLSAAPAVAQLADFDRDRVPMVELDGPWHFHAGDSPAWASAGFDDSSWSLLAAGKSWSEQGYRGYTGTAWYRLRVMLPAHEGQLALYLPCVTDSYQVFANEIVAVLIILVRSYARSRRDEERLEAELEAARAVQQVLIPTDIPMIPGFILQRAYKPASEVGGDITVLTLAADGAPVALEC